MRKISLLLLLLLCSISLVQAQSPWPVFYTSDAQPATPNTLRWAVEQAGPGEVIAFQLQNPGPIELIAPIVIDKELTIGSAQPITIDGNGNQIFTVSAPLTCVNLTFQDGNAFQGGAINTSSVLNLHFCEFINNSASMGGAIYAENGEVYSEGTTFQGNVGSVVGGAVFLLEGALHTTNNKFVHNESSLGGALHIDNSSASLENTTFINNVSSDLGGALHLLAASVDLYNCTIAGNESNQGGGIFCYNSTTTVVNLYNSIIALNQAAIAYPDVAMLNSQIHLKGGNFLGINSGISSQTGNNIVGTASFPQDPLFQYLVGDDVALTSCSEAINLGVNSFASSYTVDLAGNPRIYNSTIDAGAYEFQNARTPIRAYVQEHLYFQGQNQEYVGILSAQIKGDYGQYTYQWIFDGQVVGTGQEYENPCAGDYTLIVTNTVTGCTKTIYHTLSHSNNICLPEDGGGKTPFRMAEKNKPNSLQDKLTVFPNPTRDRIQLKLHVVAAQIMLYNTQGQLVNSYLPNTENINLTGYGKGIYILKVIDEHGSTLTKRIVLE